jgi:hypothetical protein
MTNRKRGWDNPPKRIKPPTEGSCPYCHIHVKNLEAHVESRHKGEKKKSVILTRKW